MEWVLLIAGVLGALMFALGYAAAQWPVVWCVVGFWMLMGVGQTFVESEFPDGFVLIFAALVSVFSGGWAAVGVLLGRERDRARGRDVGSP